MSELDFETGEEIWVVQFTYAGPGAIWADTLNASDEKDAIRRSIKKFRSEGLNPAMIYRVEVTQYSTFPGGEE